MKISKALRREAVEFAGCMAWWWAEWEAGANPIDQFADAVRNLAWEAWSAATVHPREEENSVNALYWAEAQAMLLDGWTP